MAENIIPCETCVTKAICLNKERIQCSILYNYINLPSRNEKEMVATFAGCYKTKYIVMQTYRYLHLTYYRRSKIIEPSISSDVRLSLLTMENITLKVYIQYLRKFYE
jgi:hypothetical protein